MCVCVFFKLYISHNYSTVLVCSCLQGFERPATRSMQLALFTVSAVLPNTTQTDCIALFYSVLYLKYIVYSVKKCVFKFCTNRKCSVNIIYMAQGSKRRWVGGQATLPVGCSLQYAGSMTAAAPACCRAKR